MDIKTLSYPVEKPYITINKDLKDRPTDASSSGRPDQLSYSYSCIKDFNKNQDIIRNLALLHNQDGFQGLGHRPTLFSLSGVRDKPVLQPFYYSPSNTGCVSSTHECNRPNRSHLTTNSLSTEFVDQPDQYFNDKNIVFEWFKCQFRSINLSWPFSISKENFFAKFSKKTKKMKMEMLLNNIDEESKLMLKKHINDLHLHSEERFNLCCNESIIEIDITPIMEDPNRLHALLSFLKKIELNTSNALDNNISGNEHSVKNKVKINNNFFIKQLAGSYNLFRTNKHVNKQQTKQNNNRMNECSKTTAYKTKNYYSTEKCAFNVNNAQPFDKKRIDKGNLISNEHNQPYTCSNERNLPVKLRDLNNHNQTDYTVYNHLISSAEKNFNLQNNSPFKMVGTNKPKLNSTVAGIYKNRSFTDEENNKSKKECKQNFEMDGIDQTGFNEKRKYENVSFGVPDCKRHTSCMCLIHEKREDYYRYKNQCLFGKGDEISNSFVKYLQVRENHSKRKILSSESSPESENTNANNNNLVKTKRSESTVTLKKDTTDKHIVERIKVTNDKSQLRENKYTHSKPYFIKHLIHHDNFKYTSFAEDRPISCKNKAASKMCNVDKYVDSNECSTSSSKRSTLNIGDVEQLVCIFNYSDEIVSSKLHSNSKSTKYKQRVPNNNSNLFNACFESLNYSANSTLNMSKSRYSLDSSNDYPTYFDEKSRSRSFTEESPNFSDAGTDKSNETINKNKTQSTNFRIRNDQTLNTNLKPKHHTKTSLSILTNCDSKENLKVPTSCMISCKNNLANQIRSEKVNNNQRTNCSFFKKQNEDIESYRKCTCTTDSGNTSQQKNINIIVNNNDQDSQAIFNINKDNTKYFKNRFLKPRHIRNTISSILKGIHENQNASSSLVMLHHKHHGSYIPKSVREENDRLNYKIKTNNQDTVHQSHAEMEESQIGLNNANVLQLNSGLVVSNLEKIQMELSSQRNDINNIKEFLCQQHITAN